MIKRSRGFTAIELMVTVAILGVLAGIAAPAMGDFIDRQRLVAQTLAVAEMAQTARSEAIKRSALGASDLRSIALTVNPGSAWSVGLASGSAACTTNLDCVLNQGGTNVPYRVTAAQCPACTMAIPTAQSTIVFDYRGIVRAAAGQTTITLHSPNSKKLTVRVSQLGRISVCSPDTSVTGYPACP